MEETIQLQVISENIKKLFEYMGVQYRYDKALPSPDTGIPQTAAFFNLATPGSRYFQLKILGK